MGSQVIPIDRAGRGQLVARFAQKFGVDQSKLFDILKATAFNQGYDDDGNPLPISNEIMASLLIVADQYNLNPFTREIYAFPDKKGGIVPVVGVDGWLRIINENSELDGLEFNYAEQTTIPEGGKECPEWIEVKVFRKDRTRPVVIREYLDEVYRPPFEKQNKKGNWYKVNGPWQSHTKRFLRHKGIIQAARVAFGFGGIYDEDEAERMKAVDVDYKVLPEPEKPAREAWRDLWDELIGKLKLKEVPKDLLEFVDATAAAYEADRHEVLRHAVQDYGAFYESYREWSEGRRKPKLFDSGGKPAGKKNGREEEPEPSNTDQHNQITNLCKELDLNRTETLRQVSGQGYLNRLTFDQAEGLINDLSQEKERRMAEPESGAGEDDAGQDPGREKNGAALRRELITRAEAMGIDIDHEARSRYGVAVEGLDLDVVRDWLKAMDEREQQEQEQARSTNGKLFEDSGQIWKPSAVLNKRCYDEGINFQTFVKRARDYFGQQGKEAHHEIEPIIVSAMKKQEEFNELAKKIMGI